MNINEHEQSNQRLRESQDLSASIIGSAMDAIIAVDDAQRIVLFNGSAEKIFACPANEAIGSSVERFIPERFRAGHSMHVRRFGESGVTNRTLSGLGTLWGLRVTGEEFPIEASISKVESGGPKYFTIVVRDITERRRSMNVIGPGRPEEIFDNLGPEYTVVRVKPSSRPRKPTKSTARIRRTRKQTKSR